MKINRDVLISGAGPSGIAAAIKLHQLGWRKIYLVEKEKSLRTVNRGKAFNYQLDGRGQKMLADIGIDENIVKEYGVANLISKFTVFKPDGQSNTLTIPFVLKDKQTAYWITRSALIDMLLKRLNDVNKDGRIDLILGHSFIDIDRRQDKAAATIETSLGATKLIEADLILGCDGLNSNVRKCLAKQSDLNSQDYTMVAKASPSSNLLYKVICLPAQIKVDGNEVEVTDNLRSYIFPAIYKKFNEKLSLFSLPVARENEQRTANIIMPESHKLWTIKDENEFKNYLEAGFPQLDIDEVFPDEEIKNFLGYRPGKFPDPQYSPKVHAKLGEGSSVTNFVLIGDAAHSFPPDLGLGVNSALEDMFLFGKQLEELPSNIELAAKKYEKERLPESRALVRLVRKVFPYQYNHVPWRFKISMAKFFMQLGLTKISGGLIDPPGFKLCQNEKLSYRDLEKRILMTDATLYAALALILGGVFYLISKVF